MYQVGLYHCRLVILVSSYQSSTFEMQFVYSMDGELQIYQQNASVVVELVFKTLYESLEREFHCKHDIQNL